MSQPHYQSDSRVLEANALVEEKKFAQAEQLYKTIIGENPKDFGAYLGWIDLACQTRNFPFAVKIVEVLVAEVPPEHVCEMYLVCAEKFAQSAQHKTVIYILEKANATRPPKGYAKAWLMIAKHLNVLTKSEEAFAALDNAEAALEEEEAAVRDSIQLNRGIFLLHSGKAEEASALFETMLRESPESLAVMYNYATSKKITEDDAELVAIIEAYRPRAVEEDRSTAGYFFTLGKVYRDLKRYEDAFEAYEEGNKRARTLMEEYDKQLQATIVFAKDTTDAITPAFLEKYRDAGNDSKMPLYVVGMPRSGTTLTEQILSGHSKVQGIGEQTFLNNLSGHISTLFETQEEFPQCMKEIPAQLVTDIAEKYLGLLQEQANGKPFVVDKMPYNFLYVGLAALLFPNSKFVHITRDPRDNAVSNYFTYFDSGNEWARKFEWYAKFYKLQQDIMRYWKQALPESIYTVAYEDLAQNLEEEAKKIVAFCGLDWEEGCLNFQEGSGYVRTASTWQVRQGIYTSSIGRWKRYEKQLSPLLAALEKEGVEV